MRESRRTERMRLPVDTTELWMVSQKSSPSEVRHRKPPEDSFEAWVGKRVAERIKGTKSAS